MLPIVLKSFVFGGCYVTPGLRTDPACYTGKFSLNLFWFRKKLCSDQLSQLEAQSLNNLFWYYDKGSHPAQKSQFFYIVQMAFDQDW